MKWWLRNKLYSLSKVHEWSKFYNCFIKKIMTHRGRVSGNPFWQQTASVSVQLLKLHIKNFGQIKPFECFHYIFVILFRVHKCAGTKRIRKLKWNKSSYRDLVKFDISKGRWRTTSRVGEFYPIRITDTSENGCHVKVHYIGYTAVYDEWRDIIELQEFIILPTLGLWRGQLVLDGIISKRSTSGN